MTPSKRNALVDAGGLALLWWLLADTLHPSLWPLPTIAAGGDTPCHYPTFLYLRDHLLPSLRLHGWYPGAYLGHPLLLYYFPLPFLLMCVLSLVMPAPVAFKIGAVGGLFLLPLLTYVSCRLMRFRHPAPLVAAAGSVLFLFVEENPIWGGTIASTLVGEFSYAYGLGLAILFLAAAYRAYSQDQGFWKPAALLALTALAHGYAVLWAGCAAMYFLYGARRPARTLRWLSLVGGLAFALVGFWLVPLLADWGWTTPYADPWIDAGWRNYFPPLLWLPAVAALGGIFWTLLVDRRTGGADHRLLHLGHAVLVAAALAAAGPAVGIIDIRFVPFAHATVAILGALVVARLIEHLRRPSAAALAVVLLVIVASESQSRHVRRWALWNMSGLEAKELWPAFRDVADRLRGSVADPRVAVEYGQIHGRAGSVRMYETLPLFSGRSTLEGVYNQASVSTHPVYYVASELGEQSPNPFRSRYYATFDTEAALAHLRLFNTRDVVAVSTRLVDSLARRRDVRRVATIPPYTVFRLDGDWGYVTPMTHEPVRSSPRGWRDKAYRWFTRRPLSPVHLVFTDDPRFGLVEGDEYLAPLAVPLPGGVRVEERVERETVTIRTNRIGHPLLVKISYHPRWKARGARGPYLVSPSLMMIVPERENVQLAYVRTWADGVGALLTLAAGLGAFWWRFLRRPAAEPRARLSLAALACDAGTEPRRWGGVVPAGLLLLLVGLRFAAAAQRPDAAEAVRLHEYASRAYSEERYDAAAEYLRSALNASPDPELRPGLIALRAESVARAGRPAEAVDLWRSLLENPSPYVAQALFGLATSAHAVGDVRTAHDAAARLLRQHQDSPWAQRLRTDHGDLAQAISQVP